MRHPAFCQPGYWVAYQWLAVLLGYVTARRDYRPTFRLLTKIAKPRLRAENARNRSLQCQHGQGLSCRIRVEEALKLPPQFAAKVLLQANGAKLSHSHSEQ
jgi:hypothetical protein